MSKRAQFKNRAYVLARDLDKPGVVAAIDAAIQENIEERRELVDLWKIADRKRRKAKAKTSTDQ